LTSYSGTSYAGFNRQTTLITSGQLYEERNLVTLSRFPIIKTRVIRDGDGPRPSYRMATASPPDSTAGTLEWERPMLYTQIDIGSGRTVHVLNIHPK
jgi:hypothetical protein